MSYGKVVPAWFCCLASKKTYREEPFTTLLTCTEGSAACDLLGKSLNMEALWKPFGSLMEALEARDFGQARRHCGELE